MTNRLRYPQYWAQNGVAKDPDTDTTHPSYVANKYATQGWKSEKPPEEWQNFLSQITDEKIMNLLIDGTPYYDASVTYKNGAVYQNNGKYYVVESGTAKEINAIGATLYNQLIAAANKLLNDHLAASNPHKDTVNTLVDKSYLKSQIDDFFGLATDPKTIVYHKNIVGKAHSETPAQVGTLPTSGGTFTGQIGFISRIVVAGSPYIAIRLNPSSGVLEMSRGNTAFGLDGAGGVQVRVSSSGNPDAIFKVMLESNYNDFNIAQGYNFALPLPLISMNIATDLNDSDSVGVWTIETTSAPAFDVGKGYVVAGGTTLSGVKVPANATLVVRGWQNDTVKVPVKDISATEYTTLADLIAASGVSFTHIAQIWIYPRLTANQKSMLVTK